MLEIKPMPQKKRMLINDNNVIFWQNDGKEYAMHIQRDEFPSNPRKDQDNMSSMWCSHRRYDLGDFDHNVSLEQWITDLLRTVPENELAAWLHDNMLRWTSGSSDHEIVESFLDTVLENDDDNWRHGMKALRAFAVVMPIWLYDHSGITISTGERVYPYNDQWDSGQVGFAALTKQKTMEELREIVRDPSGNPVRIYTGEKTWRYDTVPFTEETWQKGATDAIKAEVETYDQYLTGDVWWYKIYSTAIPTKGSVSDNLDDWDEEDSCGGFYGDDMLENGMLDEVGYGLADTVASGKFQTGTAEPHTSVYWTFNRES